MKKTILHVTALLVPLLLGALTGTGQTVTDPSATVGYDDAKKATAKIPSLPAPAGRAALVTGKARTPARAKAPAQRANADCFIPFDDTYIALPRNDDGSFGPVALPFEFRLYGAVYKQVWINTNGNLTFAAAYSRFSPAGFPSAVPMVAPFWADVDTRNAASGQIHYKLSATNLIVTWDNVGAYGNMAEKRNTFQAIIGSDTDTLLEPGQNVSLRYGDMQWTTGTASSGVGGFSGVPATVGVNKGNTLDYIQVGRFNLDNSAYDGPGGAYDGVHYLDGQCFAVNVSGAGNVPPSASNLPVNNTVNVACGQTVTLDPQFLGPEVNQTVTVDVNTGSLCNTSVTTTTTGSTARAHIVITGDACNVGSHPLVLTATDNGSPTGVTTITLNVVVASCCDLQMTAAPTPVACPGGSDGALDLMVSNGAAPLTYRWSNGATTQKLAGVPVGTYTVTATDANGCSATATYTLGQQDELAPTVRTRNITLPLNAAGAATLAPTDVDNGTTDNCAFTLSIDRTAFDCANLGPNTVTLTASDAAGNVATATATVTVVDTTAPTVRTRPVTVYLNAAGQATLTAAQVNNGSSDACGVASITVGTTAFGCANLGDNTLDVNVTDTHGNAAAGSVVVTVADTLAPILSGLPANTSATASATTCSAIVHWTNPQVADNCSATLTFSHPSGAAFPVGQTTVVLTATDLAGNRTSRSFQVTVVRDSLLATVSSPTFGPGATNQNGSSASYQVSCFGGRTGTATVSVSGGCQPYGYHWSTGQTTATATGLAAGTYTVTITDTNGARATRSITLTQSPAMVATASVTPLTTFSGALPNTIYRGYEAQSLTLTGAATGGVGEHTYSWAPAASLNRTTGSTVTASPTVTTTYTLTVTDANGCAAATATVTVNVLDVRSGTKKDKVLVCHNGHEISISADAVAAHLAHPGDKLGACVGAAARDISPEASPAGLAQAPLLEAYPNPFSANMTIHFRQVETAPAQVRLYDGQGRIVAVLFDGVAEAGRDYSVPLNAENLATGIYLCRYEKLGQSMVKRLAIVK
ncbi:HYR domain-containing protein [Hymenobacter sp. BT683]|uniref:HYR domain-containing protein n=1 Tax=Hymenobacter jeongseonensis TaxID=2791027 RepID=A0ABS0INP9_9BACT|nr:nidogen-like domain-containing protein [Hymenobacter jeongseonensis]MBF9240015.1 HYR domain-containing protein [Hymenobacter jeongseonensis]